MATLKDRVVEFLTETPNQTALAIARGLSTEEDQVARETVNKVLYRGGFVEARVEGKAAPVWSVSPLVVKGAFKITVPGVAVIDLVGDASEDLIRGILTPLLAKSKTFEHDGSEAGQRAAAVAKSMGFTVA
jgi:hypothetical protein